ncbi:MAG: hypothetical protein HN704_14750 [Bacteroidetes bacterium]|nr:hypothetical protein [Bacteroidota bacterium]
MITIFRNIFDLTNPYYVAIDDILNRIKDGNSKAVIQKIRDEKDKDKRNKIKTSLPSILFSGKFSEREDFALIDHSGFIVIDIDDLQINDIDDIKSVVFCEPAVYSGFVSPSGNGLKIVVKIPPIKEKHILFFLAIEEHFNKLLADFTSTKKNEKKYKGKISKVDEKQGKYLKVHIDKSGKNLSRVCYESFDQDIYINADAETWQNEYDAKDKQKKNEFDGNVVADEGEIYKGLLKWLNKSEHYSEGNRNNYLYKLISACCRYGISKENTNNYITIDFNDLPAKELNTILDSAYKGNPFGVETYKKGNGSVIPESDHKKLQQNISAFWTVSEKGKVTIDSKAFMKFIYANGFSIYEPLSSFDDWYFIRIENMVVKKVGVRTIKHFVLNYVSKNAPGPVYDELQNNLIYFGKPYLSTLPNTKINQVQDTADNVYVFFNGFYYEITKDEVKKMDYIDLKGQHIWEKQICSETIDKIEPYKDLDFFHFIQNALGNDGEKIRSFCTSIGYTLHTYKKMSLTKVPYFCDMAAGELDGMQEGGTGKSMAMKIVKYARNVIVVDGKDYNPKTTFKFQRVKEDTQIVILDDFEEDLRDLFVKITDGFTVEAKNKNQIFIPFAESPKFMINSNKIPKGFSDSYLRRVNIVEFTNHYNANKLPYDEFKRVFFTDFKQSDWNKCYSFLFDCIQLYLSDGLISSEGGNLDKKRLIKSTSKPFADFWLDHNWRNMDDFHKSREIVSEFNAVNEGDKDLTDQNFLKRCRNLCKIYGWEYHSYGVGKNRSIRFAGFNFDLHLENKSEIELNF